MYSYSADISEYFLFSFLIDILQLMQLNLQLVLTADSGFSNITGKYENVVYNHNSRNCNEYLKKKLGDKKNKKYYENINFIRIHRIEFDNYRL